MTPNTGNLPAIPPIVLTTDFGTSDAFVGVMKGVILSINPNAVIIDLTHEIGPQNLRQGAFVLGTNYAYFPPGAIHVAVVDPGVGTHRKAMVLQTPSATFVAPDNGLLSEVVKEFVAADSPYAGNSETIPPPSPLRGWELSNPRYQRQPVSNTFHGRDIFAPAAAHLSLGVTPAEFGPALADITYRPLEPPALQGNAILGQVIYIDRFGNLVTNISLATLGETAVAQVETPRLQVDIGPRRIAGLSHTFHDLPAGGAGPPDGLQLVALFGSNGYLEIAVRDGNAAESLGLGVGEIVIVVPA